jgi:hypothetical protein
MTGKGSTATAMSVTIFSAAFVNLNEGQHLCLAIGRGITDHTTSRFKHVPLAVGSMLCVQK